LTRLTRASSVDRPRPITQDVVRKMAKYDAFFVNVMMVEELGLQVPDPDDDIVKEGVIMFLSFAGFGAMPLLG
jgi:vacuolar iron transporter family protein